MFASDLLELFATGGLRELQSAPGIQGAVFRMTVAVPRQVARVSHFSGGFTVYRTFLIAIDLHLF